MRRSLAFQSCVDFVRVESGSIHLGGWIFHPGIPIDRVSIDVGSQPVAGDIALFDRADVQAAFPECKHALRSGYDIKADFAGPDDVQNALVSISAMARGEQLRVVHALWRDLAHERGQRLPPHRVMERAGGAATYLDTGLHALSLVLTNLGALKSPAELERILDWGCGAGRIARHLVDVVGPGRVFGCDIDTEAVNWAEENVPEAHFDCTGPYPPTSFPDRFFDAVYGISVMTHLDEATQLLWLEELKRITRPGAALLLSVIGEKLRGTNMPPNLVLEYQRRGFAMFVPYYSDWFRAFSPVGYYKESFHSPESVERIWGEYFCLEEYIETGHQDLVLLRRS